MISIVIPTYNGHKNIQEDVKPLSNFLVEHNVLFEIILVDDGSADWPKSEKVTKELERTKFIRLDKNSGKGAAIKQGIKKATFDSILITDVDIPFTHQTILKFIREISKGEVPIIIGDRNTDQSIYYNNSSNLRKVYSKFFTFLVGTFVTKEYYDTQCGLKAIRTSTAEELFENLLCNRFTYDVEIIRKCVIRGIPIIKISVEQRPENINQKSSINIFKDPPKMFIDLFKIYFKIRR